MSNLTIPDICILQQNAVTNSTPQLNFNSKNFLPMIPLLYGIPSIVLSIFIITTLLRTKKDTELSSTFYLLFAISGITEVLQWIIYCFIQRLSSAPLVGFLYSWIPKDGITVSIIYFSVAYIGFLMHIPSFLLTINRLTSVLFPIEHENSWDRYITPVLIIYVFYPIIFTWQFLIMNQVRHCQIWDFNHRLSYHLFITQPPIYGIPLTLGVTSVALFVSTSCLLMNITTVYLLITRRKRIHTDNHTERRGVKAEIKMFVLTLFMFFNEFTLAVMFLISYFVSPTSAIRTIILTIQPFIVDLICLTPPWMLLIMNNKVRSRIFKSVFKEINSTIVHTRAHSQIFMPIQRGRI